MKKPHAILFDWDNTLVNTWEVLHQAVNETLDHYNHPAWEFEDFKKYSHGTTIDLLPSIFKDKWLEAAPFYYQQVEKLHLEKLQVLPHAKNLLEFLSEQNIPMALISNKRSDFLKKEVAHLEWDSFFEVVIGAGDAARDKPHPDPILLAFEKMQTQPSLNHWYVGDTTIDWQAGQDSGCQPIALWTDPSLLERKPSFYLPYLKDCLDFQATVANFLSLPIEKNIA